SPRSWCTRLPWMGGSRRPSSASRARSCRGCVRSSDERDRAHARQPPAVPARGSGPHDNGGGTGDHDRGPSHRARGRTRHVVGRRQRGRLRKESSPAGWRPAGLFRTCRRWMRERAMKVRYVITTLKKGVDPSAYEKWVREYDYKVAKTLPGIVSYTTHRIE